jgi:hypothetical protein
MRKLYFAYWVRYRQRSSALPLVRQLELADVLNARREERVVQFEARKGNGWSYNSFGDPLSVAYPLTPDSMTPLTNRSCANKNGVMIGMRLSVVPA